MSQTPLFSVVIPTHNRAHLVARAIASVQSQSFTDYELIVVDDGSGDGTPELLRTFEGPRCRIVRHARAAGASAARNAGVRAAAAPLITFLDDDDEFRPNALQCLHERFEAVDALDFLWGGRLIHEEDREGATVATREDDWQHVPCPVTGTRFLRYVLQIATSAAFTIRRALFEQLGGFDPAFRVSEDRDLFVTLASGGYRGAAVAATIIDIHENTASLSRGVGVLKAPECDLGVIAKHRAYLDLPENRAFVDEYLRTVYAGFLEAGDRIGALRTLRQLHQRGALDLSLLRRYVRHAPEFRALKSLLGYNRLRQMRHRSRQDAGAPPH